MCPDATAQRIWGVLPKYVDTFQLWLKSCKNTRFTWWPICDFPRWSDWEGSLQATLVTVVTRKLPRHPYNSDVTGSIRNGQRSDSGERYIIVRLRVRPTFYGLFIRQTVLQNVRGPHRGHWRAACFRGLRTSVLNRQSNIRLQIKSTRRAKQ